MRDKLLAAAWIPAEFGMLLFFALIAFFGGGVRAAMKRDPKRPVLDVVLQACASSFAGFITGAACLHFLGANEIYLSLAIVGIAGWLGAVLLDRAGDKLLVVADKRVDQIVGTSPRPDAKPSQESPREP